MREKKKKKKTQTQSIDDEYSILLWEQDSNSVHFEVFARLGDTQLNRSRLLFYIIFDVVESKLDEKFLLFLKSKIILCVKK